MAKPHYTVLASRDSSDPESGLVRVGAAWDSTSRKDGKPYIQVILDSRPWGTWDGKLQLYPLSNYEDEE